MRSRSLNPVVFGGLMLLLTAGCGEEETRTIEPETLDGNLEIRDGELDDRVNLEPGPATDPID